jgi:hypothetical protein
LSEQLQSHITVDNIRAEQERIIAAAAAAAADDDVLSSVSETNIGVLEESELAARRAEIAQTLMKQRHPPTTRNEAMAAAAKSAASSILMVAPTNTTKTAIRKGMHDSHLSKETWARRRAKLDRILMDYGPGSARDPPGTRGDMAHNPFITHKFPHVASFDSKWHRENNKVKNNDEQNKEQDKTGWQQQWKDQYDADIHLDMTRYSYAIFFLCLVLLLGKFCLGGDLQELLHLQQLPTVKGDRDL